MTRFLIALALAGVLTLVPLGAASASSTTAKRIAYVSGTNLVTIAADGSGVTTPLAANAHNPSISTDGARILFDSGANLQSIAADGTGLAGVCGLAGTNPALSPDGTKVAYVSGGNQVLVQSLIDCAAPDPPNLGAGSDPAWSPDGTQLVFIDSGGDIAIANATGGAPKKLGPTAAGESDPAWAPDGARIAYVSGGDLYVANADGTNRTQLTSDGTVNSSVAWAPGGDEVLFTTSAGLFARDVGGGGTTRVVLFQGNASDPTWGLAVANTTAPTVTAADDLKEGTELTALPGAWTSPGAITFSYQWERCGSAGTGCVPIAGASSTTYTLDAADVGNRVRVRVTGTTTDGSAPGVSTPTTVIGAAGPKNTMPPAITGTFIVGQTLNVSEGTWTGTNPVFTYQWQRCPATGSCTNVGANANVYVLSTEDVGSRMQVIVTATNGIGNTSATSNPTGIVASNRPVNTEPPTISREESTFVDDDDFTFLADIGEWSGSPLPTFKYQWRRCDTGGNNCTNIASATTLRYTTVAADIGKKLRVAVTATNTFGTATAVSEPSEVVAGAAPTNISRASISGSAQVGEQLFANEGTWRGSTPFSYTYEWRRCNALGAACAAIGGANAPTYVVEGADAGSRIAVAVTAKNAVGSATVQSAPTSVIADASPTTPPTTPPTTAQPSATKAPAITGQLARGKTLAAVNGTWTGDAPLRYAYQWERCSPTAPTCTPIAKATATRYTLAAADVGQRIRLRVTASNPAGAVSAFSPISVKVAATAKATAKKSKAGKPSVRAGGAKADKLAGTTGADTIHGRGGADRISGARGADRLYGDEGADAIDGGAGRDRIWGGPGNDSIVAADGEVDVIDCGSGRDTVKADKNDVLKNCETAPGKPKPLAFRPH